MTMIGTSPGSRPRRFYQQRRELSDDDERVTAIDRERHLRRCPPCGGRPQSVLRDSVTDDLLATLAPNEAAKIDDEPDDTGDPDGLKERVVKVGQPPRLLKNQRGVGGPRGPRPISHRRPTIEQAER